MREQLEACGFPNLMIFTGGGGIENCSGVPATINEMLVQSHQGVLRVFPVWPRDRAASFGRLRTPGAFLVSADFREGQVGRVVIESERGGRCRLVNPWPGRKVVLRMKGLPEELLVGERFEWGMRAWERADLEAAAPGR
jgi:hypothetical protein